MIGHYWVGTLSAQADALLFCGARQKRGVANFDLGANQLALTVVLAIHALPGSAAPLIKCAI